MCALRSGMTHSEHTYRTARSLSRGAQLASPPRMQPWEKTRHHPPAASPAAAATVGEAASSPTAALRRWPTPGCGTSGRDLVCAAGMSHPRMQVAHTRVRPDPYRSDDAGGGSGARAQRHGSIFSMFGRGPPPIICHIAPVAPPTTTIWMSSGLNIRIISSGLAASIAA